MTDGLPAPKIWISIGLWRLVFYRWGVDFVRTELPVLGIGVE